MAPASPTDPDSPAGHPGPRGAALSRRSVLRGAAALGAAGAFGWALAACGNDDAGSSASDGTGVDGDVLAPWSLVTMLNSAASLAAGEEARLPLGLGDDRGAMAVDGPAELTVDVTSVEGEVVARGLTVARHDAGLPQAYYPLVLTPPTAGDYLARAEVDGDVVETAFTVSEPDAIVIPRPGAPFPATTTPTVDAPDGVEPLCTRDPACPLHAEDLGAVLGSTPVAVLVSTPAFCQQAICGPVLDLLLDAREAAPGVTFLHVEVYRSAAEVESQGLRAELAPAVDAWGLPFEPCLFLVDADGTLARRLDVIYDADELAEGLAALTA